MGFVRSVVRSNSAIAGSTNSIFPDSRTLICRRSIRTTQFLGFVHPKGVVAHSVEQARLGVADMAPPSYATAVTPEDEGRRMPIFSLDLQTIRPSLWSRSRPTESSDTGHSTQRRPSRLVHPQPFFLARPLAISPGLGLCLGSSLPSDPRLRRRLLSLPSRPLSPSKRERSSCCSRAVSPPGSRTLLYRDLQTRDSRSCVFPSDRMGRLSL